MLSELVGGGLIGAAASLAWFSARRVAGVSGLVGALFEHRGAARSFPLGFVLGLVAVGALTAALGVVTGPTTATTSAWWVVIAGLLVGFGTQLGSGCTSGHGVCGVSRLSKRSIVATGVFMLAGMLTATFLLRALVSNGVAP